MQIEISIKSGKYLFVAVPKIKGITIVNYPRAGKWVMESNNKEFNCWKIKCEKNWEVIQLLSQITEEQAKEIVEDCPYFAKCYKKYDAKENVLNTFNTDDSCWSALESLQSLLKYNNIDLSKEHLIIKILDK